MSINTRVAEVTDQIVRRSKGPRTRYLDRIDAAGERARSLPRKAPRLRQSRAQLRGLRCGGQGGLRDGTGAQPRDRHRLQRHAVGAPALRALPRADQGGGARGRRHRAGRGRRAGDVRRRHPGRGRDGAFPVLARRHRAVDGGRPFAPDVRRGGLSRHLRQDRAWPRHRRAVLRPFARRVRARRTDALGPANDEKSKVRQLLCRGQGRPATSCWRRRRSPITRPAPAPSTAPPTPTRC